MRLGIKNRMVLGAIPILIGLAGGIADAHTPESPIIWRFDTGG